MCSLSALLYTLMTHDCCVEMTLFHMRMTVVGLIQDGDEKHYREELKLFRLVQQQQPVLEYGEKQRTAD